MFSGGPSAPSPTSLDRESRRRRILAALRADAEGALQSMADALVDLPEDKSFGQIEHALRDLAREIAASAHQAGLDAGKKGAWPTLTRAGWRRRCARRQSGWGSARPGS